ncbi:MAG: DUF167 domain-containing protein [Desulfurivibrio sp.]|nr:DUF167 domain-containing protein [Desulfurivibrio sp.]
MKKRKKSPPAGTDDSRLPLTPAEAPWLLAADGDTALLLKVRAQPGAVRTGVVGPYGDRLKIRVAAPPVDGKANNELLAFLAARCRLAKSAITLAGGAAGRDKLFRLEGITREQAMFCLFPSGKTAADNSRL